MAINQLSTANTFQEWLTTTSTLVAVANNLTDGLNGYPFIVNSAIIIGGANSSLNVYNHTNVNTLRANSSNIANISLDSGSISGNGNLYINYVQVNSNIAVVNVTGNLSVANQTILHNRITAPNANIAWETSGGYANIANINFASGNITANGLLTTQHINVWGNVVSTNVTGNLWVANNVILYNRLDAPNANISVLNVSNRITVQSLNLWGNSVSSNITGNLWVGKDTFIYGNLTVSGNVTLDSIDYDDLLVEGSVNSQNLNTSTGNITLLVGQANSAIYSNIISAIDQSIAFAIALG